MARRQRIVKTGQGIKKAPAFWILTALVMPTLFAAGLERFRLSSGVLLAWIVIAYTSFRLAKLAEDGHKQLISMTFWIFGYVFFGLTAFLQLGSGMFPQVWFHSTETVVYTYVLILLGFAAFDIGRMGSVYRSISGIVLRPLFMERTISYTRVLALAIFSLVSAPLILLKLEAGRHLFTSRVERDLIFNDLAGGSGEGLARVKILWTLLTMPCFVAFIFLLQFYIVRRRNGQKTSPVAIALMVATGLLTFLINNPIASARFWFGTIILSTGFVLMRWRKNISMAVLSLAIVLLFVMVFPYGDTYRTSTETDPLKRIQATSLTEELTEKGDYDAFVQTINSVSYVESFGLTYGRQLMGTLLFWVPRTIWSNKPLPTGVIVAEYARHPNLNLSLPLWAEMYLDGGVLLTMIAFLTYGTVVSILEQHYVLTADRSPGFISIFVPIFAAYQFFFLRGTLMSCFAYLVPLTFFIFVCTVHTRETVRSPAPFHRLKGRAGGNGSRAPLKPVPLAAFEERLASDATKCTLEWGPEQPCKLARIRINLLRRANGIDSLQALPSSAAIVGLRAQGDRKEAAGASPHCAHPGSMPSRRGKSKRFKNA